MLLDVVTGGEMECLSKEERRRTLQQENVIMDMHVVCSTRQLFGTALGHGCFDESTKKGWLRSSCDYRRVCEGKEDGAASLPVDLVGV